MGEVVVMPGVERRDLVGEMLPGELVLRCALELGIEDLVIVGRHRDGRRYVGGTFSDMDKTVGVLMDGVSFITNGDFTQGVVFETDEPQEPA